MGKVAHATSMPAIKAPKNLKQLQKMTDRYVGEVDSAGGQKEQEVLEV